MGGAAAPRKTPDVGERGEARELSSPLWAPGVQQLHVQIAERTPRTPQQQLHVQIAERTIFHPRFLS